MENHPITINQLNKHVTSIYLSTVNGHFSAVTIFSRFSRLASSPRKYHNHDLEQVIEVIYQNRNIRVVWALRPRKYQSAIWDKSPNREKRLPRKNGRILLKNNSLRLAVHFCHKYHSWFQGQRSQNYWICEMWPIKTSFRAMSNAFYNNSIQ